MIEPEMAVSVATREVDSPSWGVTEQYLAVHRVVRDGNGAPVVARLDAESEPGASNVYFELVDLDGDKEDYHLVVTIRKSENELPQVEGVWIQPRTRVYLTVWSDSMAPDELSEAIGMQPTSSWVKETSRIHSLNYWTLEAMPGVPADLGERLRHLRGALGAALPEIASLGPSCERILSIVYDDWAGQQHSSIFIGTEEAGWISAMGASIDISVYTWGPPMAEDGDG